MCWASRLSLTLPALVKLGLLLHKTNLFTCPQAHCLPYLVRSSSPSSLRQISAPCSPSARWQWFCLCPSAARKGSETSLLSYSGLRFFFLCAIIRKPFSFLSSTQFVCWGPSCPRELHKVRMNPLGDSSDTGTQAALSFAGWHILVPLTQHPSFRRMLARSCANQDAISPSRLLSRLASSPRAYLNREVGKRSLGSVGEMFYNPSQDVCERPQRSTVDSHRGIHVVSLLSNILLCCSWLTAL